MKVNSSFRYWGPDPLRGDPKCTIYLLVEHFFESVEFDQTLFIVKNNYI